MALTIICIFIDRPHSLIKIDDLKISYNQFTKNNNIIDTYRKHVDFLS